MDETPEQYKKRAEEVIAHAENDIKHGCKHGTWVTREIGLPGHMKKVDPVVQMANDDDSFYVQTFKNREEVNAFIKELVEAADEAWPESA